MHQFPTVLIPPVIQRVKSELPPIPTFSAQLPSSPGPEPQKVNVVVVAVEATAATVPSVAIAQAPNGAMPGLMLFLAAAGVIAAQVWRQITTYPQRQREHNCQAAAYPKKLEEYNRKKRHHEAEVKAARSPERVAEFRYKLLLDVLSQTIPNNDTNSRAKPGWSEAKFGNHLRRFFPGKIHTKLTLNIPGYDRPYSPDFAYIDPALNLYIDIEIDEPYVYKTGEPTHFVESRKDSQRNDFFLSRGWVVIRFSEEQVVLWPQSCCRHVAEAIAQILGDNTLLNQFSTIPDLQPMGQWTQEEAKRMAASGYRDKYCR